MAVPEYAWAFHGATGRFASGIFGSRAAAQQFIERHTLSGTLTRYPFGVGVYDWAVQNGLFVAQPPAQTTAEFIQRFTTASQEHYHYENGSLA